MFGSLLMGAVWESSGGKTLLEEVHYLGVGFEILNCELLEFVLSVSYLLLMM